jgi:hypothetical protein
MKPKRDLRSMRVAAMAGDHSAARALLKLYGYDQIAAEIKPAKPFSPRIARAVGVLTAGTNTDWEYIGPNNKICNDLHSEPRGKPARISNNNLFDAD